MDDAEGDDDCSQRGQRVETGERRGLQSRDRERGHRHAEEPDEPWVLL
jgi:hypothetical protein